MARAIATARANVSTSGLASAVEIGSRTSRGVSASALISRATAAVRWVCAMVSLMSSAALTRSSPSARWL